LQIFLVVQIALGSLALDRGLIHALRCRQIPGRDPLGHILEVERQFQLYTQFGQGSFIGREVPVFGID